MKFSYAIAVTVALTSCIDADELGEIESEITISPGTYQIQNMGGECLEIPNFLRTPGNVQSAACKLSGFLANQQFMVESAAGGFRLRTFDSQLCLEIGNSSTNNVTDITTRPCTTGLDQQWAAVTEGGYVRITAVLDIAKCIFMDPRFHILRLTRCTELTQTARSFGFNTSRTHVSFRDAGGWCADLPGYTTANGAVPQIFPCKAPPTNTWNQEWFLDPTGLAGTYRLRSRSSNLCLEGWGTTQVEQWPCFVNASVQQWELVQFTVNQWRMRNVSANRCLFFEKNDSLVIEPCGNVPVNAITIQPGAW